jgi:lipopolysaccharide export system protein LptC
MASERGDGADGGAGSRALASDLTAPRRIFRRKKRPGLVLGLKIALPLIAVAGIAFVVIWSQHVLRNTRITPDLVQDVSKQGAAVNVTRVKFDGVDAKNRPYTITAESANQPQAAGQDNTPGNSLGNSMSSSLGEAADGAAVAKTTGAKTASAGQPAPAAGQATQAAAAPDPSNIINLKQLIADMTLVNGAWVAVTADNGIYHRDTGTVDLSGNVTLFHDTGLSFETDAATVDMRNDTASGDQPIEGQRPDGELAAQGFEVLNDGQTVVFKGRAYLKLYPKSGTTGSSATESGATDSGTAPAETAPAATTGAGVKG